MAPTPESKARGRAHKCWPAGSRPFYQSMAGTYMNGVPDSYYEGELGALWVEWKWTSSKYPRTLPEPTPLQAAWLQRAMRNGLRVAVIEGCPVGYRIYPHDSWDTKRGLSPYDPVSAQATADWIRRQTGDSVDV